MFVVIKIMSDNDEIVISAFPNKENDGYEFMWLTFNEIPDPDWDNIKLTWDNPKYLFNTFVPFLERWKERMCTENDKIEFQDVWKYFEENSDLVDELLEMFEEADRLNFSHDD